MRLDTRRVLGNRRKAWDGKGHYETPKVHQSTSKAPAIVQQILKVREEHLLLADCCRRCFGKKVVGGPQVEADWQAGLQAHTRKSALAHGFGGDSKGLATMFADAQFKARDWPASST